MKISKNVETTKDFYRKARSQQDISSLRLTSFISAWHLDRSASDYLGRHQVFTVYIFSDFINSFRNLWIMTYDSYVMKNKFKLKNNVFSSHLSGLPMRLTICIISKFRSLKKSYPKYQIIVFKKENHNSKSLILTFR